MKKKKHDDQAATDIMGGEIQIDFEPGRLVFCVPGGATFFMSAENAVKVFGDQIRDKFDQVENPAGTLELFVFIERALQKGRTFQDIAQARDMDPAAVREFYNRFQRGAHVRPWDKEQHGAETRRQARAGGDPDGTKELDVSEILNLGDGTRQIDLERLK